MFLVSACLLGINCKYNGGNNKNKKVIEFLKNKKFIMVCPEELAGLGTPRIPCELIQKENGDIEIINKEGKNLTKKFLNGANEVLKIAKSNNVKKAILKAKSPSCGNGLIYDGSFTSTLIVGDGITTKLLKENNIEVFTEDEI